MLLPDRIRRKKRVRKNISGTAELPRLSVYRSNKYLYAQLVDDVNGVTLASAKGAKAHEVGTKVAEVALAKNIKKIVFDRNGFIYHGRIQQLADAARAAGLVF